MKQYKINGLPIFYRLLFALWGVMILIGSVWTAFFYFSSRAAVEKGAEERIFQQMDAISFRVNDELQKELARNIRLLASNPSVDEYMMSSAAEKEINVKKVEQLFLQYLRYTPDYEGISFVDSSGKEKIRVGKNGQVKVYPDFKHSELFNWLESREPGTVHSFGPFKDVHGRYVVATGISKLDQDTGKFGGAIIVDYSLENFFRTVGNIKIFDENPVWILNSDGQALKQPANSLYLLDPRPYLSKNIQKEAKFMVVDRGMLMYQDMYFLPGEPLMRLAISVPYPLLLKDISLTVRLLLMASALALFLISALAYYLSRYMSRPIIILARAATQLSKGDLSSRVKVKTTGEVQFLIDSFNQMAENLDETTVSKEELEQKVKERTQQLLEAQEQLVHKEKLAVLGQVAASVAHELRNPLGVMSNAVFFLQTVLADADDSVKEYLVVIKNEIAGSAQIVSDLLDAVRTKQSQPQVVEVREAIRFALDMLTMPPTVAVKLDIPEILPALLVDAQQIRQVFRNLISNGIEAMPDGGTLKISAVENKPEGTVTVSVRDSGVGMTPEQLGKLFQPLFTTKARGIGLGLVVVKNLTEANGGTVKVESEAGKGSVFSVTLPDANSTVAKA